MIKIGLRTFICDEGKVFISKDTGVIFGSAIDLCDDDSIDNYDEVDNIDFDKMFSNE